MGYRILCLGTYVLITKIDQSLASPSLWIDFTVYQPMTYGYTVTTLSNQKPISTFQLIIPHEPVRRQAAHLEADRLFSSAKPFLLEEGPTPRAAALAPRRVWLHMARPTAEGFARGVLFIVCGKKVVRSRE